jgi:hypothetical protein
MQTEGPEGPRFPQATRSLPGHRLAGAAIMCGVSTPLTPEGWDACAPHPPTPWFSPGRGSHRALWSSAVMPQCSSLEAPEIRVALQRCGEDAVAILQRQACMRPDARTVRVGAMAGQHIGRATAGIGGRISVARNGPPARAVNARICVAPLPVRWGVASLLSVHGGAMPRLVDSNGPVARAEAAHRARVTELSSVFSDGSLSEVTDLSRKYIPAFFRQKSYYERISRSCHGQPYSRQFLLNAKYQYSLFL